MSKPNGHESFKPLSEQMTYGLTLKESETFSHPLEGHLFAILKHNDGREEHRDLGKNIITNAASVLLARLVRNNSDPAHGAYALAVGTGAIGWDPFNPPPATASQTQLQNELFRKTFQSVNFTVGGTVSGSPTNVLDLTTFFVESEANGILVEMGIVGGDATLTANTGTLLNYRTFAAITKPPTATLSLVWRITF